MIYFALGCMAAAIAACIVCIVYLFERMKTLRLLCDKNLEFISRHAAEHVRMNNEHEEMSAEVADKIAQQIEKKWDEGLSKMLSWTPYPAGESDGV